MGLRLLGPDEATVLFDFMKPTGAGNPNTLMTKLADGPDFGTVEPSLRLSLMEAGANLLGMEFPPVEVSLGVIGSAATDDDLWAGFGQLARFLIQCSRDHPLYLEWDELGTSYKYDVIGALSLPQLIRGQDVAGLISPRKHSMGPVPIRLLRQPWRRGAATTTTERTVPNDPNVAGTPSGLASRSYAVTVGGDLPTPGRVRVEADGGTITRLLLAHQAQKSQPASRFTDYLSDTAWFQCEASGRGWTITLGTNTTATTDATASPGGGGNTRAQCTFATNPTERRAMVRATRTTKLESLRGSWDVWVRLKPAVADDEFRVALGWGLGTPNPAPNVEPEIRHGPLDHPPGADYVERYLGRIDVPHDVATAGLVLELLARRADGSSSLSADLMWLVPAGATALEVPGGAANTTPGAGLFTPLQITGDAAWTLGGVVGTARRLDANSEGAGTLGQTLPVGLNSFTFHVDFNSFSGTLELRVINDTDDVEVASATYTLTGGIITRALTFSAIAGKTYQAQAVITSYTSGNVEVDQITHEFLNALAAAESARTDPKRYAVDRLDSSGNVNGRLNVEGSVPVMLWPGENLLHVRADEAPLGGVRYGENELARVPSMAVTYEERRAL